MPDFRLSISTEKGRLEAKRGGLCAKVLGD